MPGQATPLCESDVGLLRHGLNAVGSPVATGV
jgi:hypothetical protein